MLRLPAARPGARTRQQPQQLSRRLLLAPFGASSSKSRARDSAALDPTNDACQGARDVRVGATARHLSSMGSGASGIGRSAEREKSVSLLSLLPLLPLLTPPLLPPNPNKNSRPGSNSNGSSPAGRRRRRRHPFHEPTAAAAGPWPLARASCSRSRSHSRVDGRVAPTLATTTTTTARPHRPRPFLDQVSRRVRPTPPCRRFSPPLGRMEPSPRARDGLVGRRSVVCLAGPARRPGLRVQVCRG